MQEIMAANMLLLSGVYALLAMGGLLFLLGFLGCCAALRENKCLLLSVSAAAQPHNQTISARVGGGAGRTVYLLIPAHVQSGL